jgi:tetratricopeptide (TPR) repeat protein
LIQKIFKVMLIHPGHKFENMKFFYRFPIGFITLACIALPASAAPDRDILERAQTRWISGSLEHTAANQTQMRSAIEDYSTVIKLQPKSVIAYQGRAQLHAKLDNWPKALSDYSQLITLEPNQIQHYQDRAEIRARTKDLTGAIADLTTAIGISPDNPALYVRRSELQAAPADRIADLTTAIAKRTSSRYPGKENLAALYQARGEAEGDRGDNLAEISDLTRAIESRPDLITAYVLRRDAYELDRNQKAANADRETAITLLNAQEADRYGPQKIFLQGAIKRQERLAITREDDYLAMGLDAADRGSYKFAHDHFTTAIKRQPKLAESYVYRATIQLLANDDYDSLVESPDRPSPIQDLTQAIALAPKIASYYALRATVYEVNSDYQSAIQDLTRAIGLTPNDVDLYLQRKRNYLVVGNLTAEAKDVETIARLEARKSKTK